MRRQWWAFRPVVAAMALAVIVGGSSPEARGSTPRIAAPTSGRTSCTPSEKQQRLRALATFKRNMAAARGAYFRAHRGAKARKVYVRKQQATLRALQRAAACTVVSPPSPPPNAPPVARMTVSTRTPYATDMVRFDATSSTDADGTIASYAWAFGDGATASGGATTSHAYATQGTYTATVTVMDNLGATSAASVTLTVAALPPLPAPPPGPGQLFTFDSGISAAGQDEITGDVAYAVQDEAVLLGVPITSVRTFVSNNPAWLADQQCRFYGHDDDSCRSVTWKGGGAAAGGPGAIFLNWANDTWRYGPGQNQKIIAHELFHTFQYQLDKLVNNGATPPNQVRPSGPVWFDEGAPEMVGYRVAADRRLFPSYANAIAGQIAMAKTISTPLSSLETLSQTQIPNIYTLFLFAVDHLISITPAGLPALTTYLNALGAGMAWQDAFKSAFGMTIDAYYANFAAYRAGP